MNRRFFISSALIPVVAAASPSAAASDLFGKDKLMAIGAAIYKASGDQSGMGRNTTGFSFYMNYTTGYEDHDMMRMITNPPAMVSPGRRMNRQKGVIEDLPAEEVPNSSRLNDALKAVKQTGLPHAIGTGNSRAKGMAENRFEYGLLVRPDGTALFIVREYMGNQPMGPETVRARNSKLEVSDLPSLSSNHAGYHTIYGLEIDAQGKGTPVAVPDKIDLRQFGVNSPFGNLPRDAQPVSAAPTAKLNSPRLA